MSYRVLLILIALINFIAPLGFVPLFDLDEGAFSEATREMIQSGNYITTYLDGALRFDKPILIYWLQAFSVKTFGLNEFALRFPSAVAGLLWGFAIWSFTKKELGEKAAFFATLFMLSALQVNLIAKAAIADSLLNLFIATSLFAIWQFLESKNRVYLYASFALIALGTLTKGPVAIMIPLITVAIYMGLKREFKEFFKIIFNPIGILIFLAIALPWYYLEYLDQGQKFIDGFFLKHNIGRFSSAMESHRGSIFYFIPVILLGFLPFTSILIKTLAKAKEIFSTNLGLFLIIWFAFVFIFFSLSGTKLPHYVVYGYTPLFILMGAYSAKRFKEFALLDILPILALYATLFALPFFTNYMELNNRYVEDIIKAIPLEFGGFYLSSIAIAFILTIAIKYSKFSLKIKSVIIALLFTILLNFVVIKAYANIAQQPIKDAALYAKEHSLKPILYHITKPSFLLYLNSKSLKEKPSKDKVILLKSKNLKDFKSYKILYSKYGIYLIKLTK